MRQIIIECSNGIVLSDVEFDTPIFAKKNEKLTGMLVKEEKGWILRTGGSYGATGHHSAVKECIISCLKYGYTFFVE